MPLRVNNLLNIAMRTIGTNALEYRLYSGSTVNEFGKPSVSYGEWKGARASIQPGIVSSFGGKCISEKEYQELGLSWARTYVTVWVNNVELTTSENEEAADQIRINGKVYNVLQVENWLMQNGWKRCYCVLKRGEDGE